jgi:hypothetical protein
MSFHKISIARGVSGHGRGRSCCSSRHSYHKSYRHSCCSERGSHGHGGGY